jgi:hypothetical protein
MIQATKANQLIKFTRPSQLQQQSSWIKKVKK